MSVATSVKVLPWGEEIYLEIPLHKRSANKFYARHGKTSEGRNFIEFSKFGPRPNTEGETYIQKLRLFSPEQWLRIKHYVEGDLAASIGWDLVAAAKEFKLPDPETTPAPSAAPAAAPPARRPRPQPATAGL